MWWSHLVRWPHLVTAWWPKPAIDTHHSTPFRDSQMGAVCTAHRALCGDWISTGCHHSVCSLTFGLEKDLISNVTPQWDFTVAPQCQCSQSKQTQHSLLLDPVSFTPVTNLCMSMSVGIRHQVTGCFEDRDIALIFGSLHNRCHF